MRTRQTLAAIGALTLTAVAVTGVPWFLVRAVGNPWPGRTAIDLGDDTAIVTGILALVAWVMWCRFAIAVAVEIPRQLAAHRAAPTEGVVELDAHPLGSGGAFSRVAGALVAAILALLPIAASATPAVAHGPLPARRSPVPAAPAVPEPAAATAMPQPSSAAVTVARGDTLYSLARTHLGDASRWREIFELNRDRVQPDGGRLSTPSLIRPGWQLILPAVPAEPPRSHRVERGDSYWEIAAADLTVTSAHEPTPAQVLAYAQRLMDTNAPRLGHDDPALIIPGEVVALDATATPLVAEPNPAPAPEQAAFPGQVTPAGPAAPGTDEPAPATSLTATRPGAVAPTSTTSTSTIPLVTAEPSEQQARWPQGLAAATLLAVGVGGLVHSRRRAVMRAAPRGGRLPHPSEPLARTERTLAMSSRVLQMARLDVAVRAAAPAIAAQRARLLALTLAADGRIRLLTDLPCTPAAGAWRLDIESGCWLLPASTELTELAEAARHVPFPSPALVALGSGAHGEVFVDLEAVGLLCVDAGPAAVSVARHLAASLCVSPFAEAVTITTVGIDGGSLEHNEWHRADDVEAGLAHTVAAASSTTAAVVPGDSTFAMRVSGAGETWDPAVLVMAGVAIDEALAEELAGRTAGGGRGVAIVVDQHVDGAGAVLQPVSDGFILQPFGLDVHLTGLAAVDLEQVNELIAAAGEPAIEPPIPLLPDSPSATPYAEPAWTFLVQTLGHVAVLTDAGEQVRFERSKALELVVWLATHRDRPTRTRARTALWELDVRDATFANVVSDARRAMARAVAPPQGEEWIGRKLTEQLPLHALVVTDADLLASRLGAARGLPVHDAIEVLRPGLELVGGMPFADTAYLWTDGEGLASGSTLLITSAASELAGLFLTIGDIEGVFWATGQGLKVLPGHEELIALRMRAHAEQGDLAGVRHEWAAYERALNAELWAGAGAEPSPKLVSLRRRLLAPSASERAS